LPLPRPFPTVLCLIIEVDCKVGLTGIFTYWFIGSPDFSTVPNEVNLSESSSESSGDELIANLDYESILGLGAPSENPETCSNQGNNAVPQIETKDSQPQAMSKSKSTTRKTICSLGKSTEKSSVA
jgi:hypothetical protein